MIRIIEQCLETQNEDGARQLFDVFETLLILVCTTLCTSFCAIINFFGCDVGNPASKS